MDKTQLFQPGASSDHDSDDDSAPDLSFLHRSSKPGSIGTLAHYEILQLIGQGGFGIVLKAFDEKLRRLVAIKVMNPEMAATSPARKRFLREARAAAAIRHENVVAVHSVDERPLPYLVMDYIDGQTLQQKMDDAGPLEVSEVLRIGRQIASGLAAAHAMGLIHRDIKPGNILLEQGPDEKVKITDFGLARAADDASVTRTGIVCGTPMYMAPEQAQGQTLDHRADLFSFGSVLYQMACGRPPFRAPTTVAVLRRVSDDTPRPMQEILPEISGWLVAIVAKLHAKQPGDRFQSAKEVADLLARCQSELQLQGKVTCIKVDESLRDSNVSSRSDEPTTPSESKVDRSLRDRKSSSHGVTRLLSRKTIIIISAIVAVGLFAAFMLNRANNATTENLAKRAPSAPDRSEPSNGVEGLTPSVSPVESTDSTDSDRGAAEWTLLIGGTIRIKENGEERGINAGRDLPDGAFELIEVQLSYIPKVSDAGLAHFRDCNNLTKLDLSITKVTDVGLAHFKDCKNLTTLYLGRTQVTDASLERLADYPKLGLLQITKTKVTEAGVKKLSAALPGCKIEWDGGVIEGDQK